ncbi:hypothetical protein DMH04_02155 [Kibdelosporangium aridum]|uniref:Uncharacterized protein n=1 Tax=Kibdelosporangium aridum TaxID=2030 RepID=A0A428ZUT9_KIBAR|nr:hypothetical protein [Kibdelosporangium aridum]RSM91795.1 hypothetical protein DMH04_02155 [Kibdelosporangium aridum]
MNGFARALAGLALVAPAIGALQGCSPEKICATGEVVIERAGGGRTCQQPAPGDRTCPSGQILLKNPDAGREGCIPNVYSSDPYTDKLGEYVGQVTKTPVTVDH